MTLDKLVNEENFIYYLSKARAESKKSIIGKAQVGAVLVKKGCIISKGHNRIKYSKVNDKYSRWKESTHAEVDALKKVMYLTGLNSTTLFVYRELKSGELASSKPCDKCMAFIKFLKIKRIVYTINKFPYYEVVRL